MACRPIVARLACRSDGLEQVRRAESLLDSEALPALDEALALVEGPPFQGSTGYSEACSDGTATLITVTIKTAARCPSEAHLRQGRKADTASDACAALAAIGAPLPQSRPLIKIQRPVDQESSSLRYVSVVVVRA